MPKIFDLIFEKTIPEMLDDDLYNNYSPRKSKSIRPSELGGCLRALVLGMLHKPPKPRKSEVIDMLRRFEDGKARHNRIVDKFKEIDILIEAEKELTLDNNANGRIDAIIKRNGDKIPIEIKGVSTRYWSNIPFFKHKIQTTYYMMRCGSPYGILLYENKDSQHQKEIIIDDYLVPDVEKRLKTVRDCYKNNQLPDRDYSNRSMQCRNCVWRRLYCYDIIRGDQR